MAGLVVQFRDMAVGTTAEWCANMFGAWHDCRDRLSYLAERIAPGT
jgi:hypothetical protein